MLSLIETADAVFEIDLKAVQANFRTISSLVGPHVKVAAVVKSDAYGLGMVEIARALVNAGCDLFFVANLHEALLLRSSQIGAAVAVFRDEFARFSQCYRSENLIPLVNNGTDMDAIRATGEPQTYFLNVETGFSRLGLAFDDVRRFYLSGAFKQYPPAAMLSHLACSDCAADATNVLQKNRFRATYDLLKPTFGSLAASAGVWLDKSYHFNMVRVGSALYGLNNAGIQPNPLQPVVSLRAKVLDTRIVARREAVGYGATFRTARTSRIATAAIGYKHGLPWSCANKISVRIGEYTAPVIGRISMEYIAIDVTDIPETVCGIGAAVEILGKDFAVDDFAAAAGVNPQEVLTRLGAGCTRQHLNASSLSAASAGNPPHASGSHSPFALAV